MLFNMKEKIILGHSALPQPTDTAQTITQYGIQKISGDPKNTDTIIKMQINFFNFNYTKIVMMQGGFFYLSGGVAFLILQGFGFAFYFW